MSDIAGDDGDLGVAHLRPVGGTTKRLIDIVLASIGIVMLRSQRRVRCTDELVGALRDVLGAESVVVD